MDEINWDKDIWNVINSFFQNTENYLSKHQIESYNNRFQYMTNIIFNII